MNKKIAFWGAVIPFAFIMSIICYALGIDIETSKVLILIQSLLGIIQMIFLVIFVIKIKKDIDAADNKLRKLMEETLRLTSYEHHKYNE